MDRTLKDERCFTSLLSIDALEGLPHFIKKGRFLKEVFQCFDYSYVQLKLTDNITHTVVDNNTLITHGVTLIKSLERRLARDYKELKDE